MRILGIAGCSADKISHNFLSDLKEFWMVFASHAAVVTLVLFAHVALGSVYSPYITNNQVLMVDDITSLDSIEIVGGMFFGGSMTYQVDSALNSALKVCESVESVTRRSYLFTIVDCNCCVCYSKFVKVYLDLINNGVYVSANRNAAYTTDTSAASSCSAAASVFANGNSISLATSPTSSGYGIYDMEYRIVKNVYANYVTTSAVSILSDVAILDGLVVYGAMIGGLYSAVPSGQYCNFVCGYDGASQTSTSRTFILGIADPNFKLVKIIFGLSGGSLTLAASGITRFLSSSAASGSPVGCDTISAFYDQGSDSTLATSADTAGFGVLQVSYGISIATPPTPTLTPSLRPTLRPSAAPTRGYQPYVSTVSAVLTTGVGPDDWENFALTAAMFGGQGSAVPEGQSCDFVCLMAETDSTRMFALGVKDPTYYKFVVVNFQLEGATISMNAMYGHYLDVATMTVSNCEDVSTAIWSYGTDDYHIALHWYDVGYGVFNLAYTFSDVVTTSPTVALTSAPISDKEGQKDWWFILVVVLGPLVLMLLAVYCYFSRSFSYSAHPASALTETARATCVDDIDPAVVAASAVAVAHYQVEPSAPPLLPDPQLSEFALAAVVPLEFGDGQCLRLSSTLREVESIETISYYF